jgi:predicted metal-dependent hydrolase
MSIIVLGIPVDIVKKDIKNLHLTVAPPDGAVHVSAPLSMSDDSIERFVRTRIGWIRNQQNKYHQQLRQTERQYVSGETLYVWGKQYFLRVEYSYKGNSVILNGDKAVLTVRKESTAKQREAFINEWYRSLLKAEIERLLPLWEKRTGLKCSSWQTKYMTTKWGTCSKDSGKIWFNLQLAKKPIECLEYVILHELTHLLIDNHGEDFVSYMDAKMPFWRETRKKLNDSIMDYMDSNADIESRE